MVSNAKILVAEDDSVAAYYLSQSLNRIGYRVIGVVQSGDAAIESACQNQPDIILMDITLGGNIDGICAAERIHARFDIPVIYLTANSDSEVFERARGTEPYAFIIKPFEIYQLQNAIEIALIKHHLQQLLKESNNRYRTIFEVSDNAMMLVDENGTIIMVNEQFETMTGILKESVELKMSWTDFFEEDGRAKLENNLRMADDGSSGTKHHFETILAGSGGETRIVYCNVKRIPGTTTRIVSMNDISELKSAEQEIRQLNMELNATNKGLLHEISLREKVERQLRYKATHDYLTGLPNRVLLFDRIKQAFAFEKRHNTIIALMILDLDNFKDINDSLGHLSGDILLKKVALGLQGCMRQYDTVGRLGGDEFVLIINDAYTIQDISVFADKVLSVFREPFDVLGKQVHVTASIGVAVYPLHGGTIELLLKKADLAMYVAKKCGRNTFRFFSESTDSKDSSITSMRTKRRLTQMEHTSQNSIIAKLDAPPAKDHVLH